VRRLHGRAGAPLAVLTLCVALALSAGPGAGPALGKPGNGSSTGAAHHPHPATAYPSQQQVVDARASARRKAEDVGRIKARLLLANQRLESAATRAEQASEAYNGALWRLQQAKDKLRAARTAAAGAQRTVAAQRDRIGALVAQSYQDGGNLTTLHAMAGADGPQGVLDQYVAFQGASSSFEADYQRFDAAESLAQVFERRAARAKAEQVQMTVAAHQARDHAVAMEQGAQAEAAQIATEKDRLIRQLAAAQDISVSLARQRQSALEEIARQRAVERARREAIAAARAKAVAEARAHAQAAARQRAADAALAAAKARASQQRSGHKPGQHADGGANDNPGNGGGNGGDDGGGNGGGNGSGNGSGASPPPPPTPAPDPGPPSPSGGAAQAIRYAKAQLGEPYQWGAAGPGSWDCSGLTMRAWGSAGVSLAHYTVAQYDEGTPISVSDLRPGDLVFWSSNGRPSGIHHVAMYIGGGQIIHAPRTGRPVEIDDMYYWIPPDFFVRV